MTKGSRGRPESHKQRQRAAWPQMACTIISDRHFPTQAHYSYAFQTILFFSFFLLSFVSMSFRLVAPCLLPSTWPIRHAVFGRTNQGQSMPLSHMAPQQIGVVPLRLLGVDAALHFSRQRRRKYCHWSCLKPETNCDRRVKLVRDSAALEEFDRRHRGIKRQLVA